MTPAIIQDDLSGNVLMLGYMNEEALAITRTSGNVTFYSRSKKRLWTKGESSGNFLRVKQILIDCDKDAILIKAIPAGPVCHTGSDTCFGENNKFSIQLLESIIAERRNEPSGSSYTSSLIKSGINKIAQKFGEEAVELLIESKDDNRELFIGEATDLLFHYLVLLNAKNCSFNDVVDVLAERHLK